MECGQDGRTDVNVCFFLEHRPFFPSCDSVKTGAELDVCHAVCQRRNWLGLLPATVSQHLSLITILEKGVY